MIPQFQPTADSWNVEFEMFDGVQASLPVVGWLYDPYAGGPYDVLKPLVSCDGVVMAAKEGVERESRRTDASYTIERA